MRRRSLALAAKRLFFAIADDIDSLLLDFLVVYSFDCLK